MSLPAPATALKLSVPGSRSRMTAAMKFPLCNAASHTCWKSFSFELIRRMASLVALNAANILKRRGGACPALAGTIGPDLTVGTDIASLFAFKVTSVRRRPLD